MNNFSNWGDFLATPPNMIGTPPILMNNDIMSNLQPQPSPTPIETPLPEVIPPSITPTPVSPQISNQTPVAPYGDGTEIENRSIMV